MPTPPTAYDDAAKGPGLAGLLEIARRRRVLAVLPFLFVLTAAASLAVFLPSLWTSKAIVLVNRQQVPERYVAQLRARLETEAGISAVTNMEAVYLGPGEVLVAADVAMADGLSGADIALALARTRAAIATELPVVARLYLTPVVADP